jgi:hypothetical protein
MFRYKGYYPDKGLTDFIIFNNQEFEQFMEMINMSDFLEANNEEKEQKELILVELYKNREPFLIEAEDSDFTLLVRRYEVEERYVCFVHEKVAETHEVTKRYKTLRENSRSP